MNKLTGYGIAGILFIALATGLYWQTKRLGAVEAIQEQKDEAIKIYADAFDKATTARTIAENKMQVARDQEAKDGGIFNVHDITKDIQAKPGLVAARATASYLSLWASLESITDESPKAPATAVSRSAAP